MGPQEPLYGHHIEDITEYIDEEHGDKLQKLIDLVEKKIEKEGLTNFIGDPPCPDFSVAGKNRGRNGEKWQVICNVCATNLYHVPGFFPF